jgi:predicted AlkP superfamily phosphohydrolase/phosphomutase
MKKVFIFGIDGAPPQYVLDLWLDDLPNIKKLLENSIYSDLETTIPPSTIVAWTSMITGKDPSHFNVYSYTYKDENNKTKLSNSTNIKAKRIFEYLSEQNKKSILISVPLTYPVTPLNGIMLSGFLTPSFNEKSIYPHQLKDEILSKFNQEYSFDVNVGLAGYKELDSDNMIEKVYKMTDLQLKIVKDFIKNKEWDFFMTVFLGTDRMQHTMWRFFDKNHRKYPGPTKYENAIKDYYKYLDNQIGIIKEMLDEDCYFIIASDHGFDRMDGRFNLNDWLIKEGYLTLLEKPSQPQKLNFSNVDWSKTKAYAIGAYFGRIFFNKISKDPKNGIVSDNQIKELQNEIIEKLKPLTNDKNEPMENYFFKPQDIYNGPYVKESPDLYIYFDNLRWGVNNDVSNIGFYSQRTTSGSDDAGHSPKGTFILNHKNIKNKKLDTINIIDILPTIFNAMQIQVPPQLKGKNLLK